MHFTNEMDHFALSVCLSVCHVPHRHAFTQIGTWYSWQRHCNCALSGGWPVSHCLPCWPSAFLRKLQVQLSLSHCHLVSYCTALAAHILRDFMLIFTYHATLCHFAGWGLL